MTDEFKPARVRSTGDRYSKAGQHQYGDRPDARVERIHDGGFDVLQCEEIHDPCRCRRRVEGEKQPGVIDERPHFLGLAQPCPSSEHEVDPPNARIATTKKLMD